MIARAGFPCGAPYAWQRRLTLLATAHRHLSDLDRFHSILFRQADCLPSTRTRPAAIVWKAIFSSFFLRLPHFLIRRGKSATPLIILTRHSRLDALHPALVLPWPAVSRPQPRHAAMVAGAAASFDAGGVTGCVVVGTRVTPTPRTPRPNAVASLFVAGDMPACLRVHTPRVTHPPHSLPHNPQGAARRSPRSDGGRSVQSPGGGRLGHHQHLPPRRPPRDARGGAPGPAPAGGLGCRRGRLSARRALCQVRRTLRVWFGRRGRACLLRRGRAGGCQRASTEP